MILPRLAFVHSHIKVACKAPVGTCTPCTRLLSKTAHAIAVVLALAVVARLHTIQHSVTFVCRTQKAKAELFRSMPRLLAVLYFSQGVLEDVAAFLAACPT